MLLKLGKPPRLRTVLKTIICSCRKGTDRSTRILECMYYVKKVIQADNRRNIYIRNPNDDGKHCPGNRFPFSFQYPHGPACVLWDVILSQEKDTAFAIFVNPTFTTEIGDAEHNFGNVMRTTRKVIQCGTNMTREALKDATWHQGIPLSVEMVQSQNYGEIHTKEVYSLLIQMSCVSIRKGS